MRGVRILPGNIGYLDLAFFAGFDFADRNAPPRVAIDAALALLQWTDAVVIDLRDNGGGSPAMVGYLTSAFTPRGADIYNTFHSRQGTSSEAPLDWHPAPRLDVPLYVLGSSMFGATLAAALGLPYAFASHFAPQMLEPAVAAYRSEFRPSDQLDRPYVIAGVNVVAAGPLKTIAAKSIPGFVELEESWDARVPLGWDTSDPTPVARAAVALLSDLFPATSGSMVMVDGGFHALGFGTEEIAQAAAQA